MHILHIYKDYYPVLGGIENHIKLLAETQAAHGHTVSVLVTSRDNHTHVEMLNGARVIVAARNATLSSAPVSFAMFDLIRRENPDVAHLQFPYPLGEIANLLFGHARKTIITYQSDIVRQKYLRIVYTPLMHRVLTRADRLIASSPNYIASSPVLSRYKNKCTVVPLGIDPKPFELVPIDYGKKEDGVTLLFVGRLRYYKGLNYLIQALPNIPRAHLVIVGTGSMKQEWRMLAKERQVEDRIKFMGDVPNAELPSYYAASDIFVLPASERSEAYGLVQLEAMASGKPVVCTELGTGTSFVNVDGETGFVVPARNSHALASAINRLIDDPELRVKFGSAGRARVRQEFTIDKMIERVMKVYES